MARFCLLTELYRVVFVRDYVTCIIVILGSIQFLIFVIFLGMINKINFL